MMYMVFYMTDDLGETFTEMNEGIETFIINGKNLLSKVDNNTSPPYNMI